VNYELLYGIKATHTNQCSLLPVTHIVLSSYFSVVFPNSIMAITPSNIHISALRYKQSIQFNHQIHIIFDSLMAPDVLQLILSTLMVSTYLIKNLQDDINRTNWSWHGCSVSFLLQFLLKYLMLRHHSSFGINFKNLTPHNRVPRHLNSNFIFKHLRKGGFSCAQFIQYMHSLADCLRSIGSDISDQDLVLYTL
jgi:hypothetical protein